MSIPLSVVSELINLGQEIEKSRDRSAYLRHQLELEQAKEASLLLQWDTLFNALPPEVQIQVDLDA